MFAFRFGQFCFKRFDFNRKYFLLVGILLNKGKTKLLTTNTKTTMVSAVKKIAEIKKIGVIDLYTDTAFNDITNEQHELYMADKIHPTKAGYLEWWTPKMEQYIYDYIKVRLR